MSLASLSRSRSFLWKFALGMIGAGLLLGYLLSTAAPPPVRDPGARLLAAWFDGLAFDPRSGFGPESGPPVDRAASSPRLLALVESELARPGLELFACLELLTVVAPLATETDHVAVSQLVARRFGPDEGELARLLLAALGDDGAVARGQLDADAPDTLASPARHYARGLVALQRKDFPAAYAHFLAVADHPAARQRAVYALQEAENPAELRRLADDPRFAADITPHVQLEAAIQLRDWRGILEWVPRSQLASFAPGPLVITGIAALAWGFFLLQLGEVGRLRDPEVFVCALGFLAGALSTTPTLYAVIWQDDVLGWSPDRELLRVFAYYIGAVGLREEVAKLLLFLPLLPWLVRRGDDLTALIVASFVGLGFAIEENLNYLASGHGIAAPGRFLTANFLHTTLTGLNGLALYRACTHGMRGLNEFLTVLPATIAAHGAYDALLSAPALGDDGYLSLVVYVGCVFYYFKTAFELRQNLRRTLGLTGAFVFGVSVLAAAVIVHHMLALGPADGAAAILPELVGSGVLVIVFLRTFNEQLAA